MGSVNTKNYYFDKQTKRVRKRENTPEFLKTFAKDTIKYC